MLLCISVFFKILGFNVNSFFLKREIDLFSTKLIEEFATIFLIGLIAVDIDEFVFIFVF